MKPKRTGFSRAEKLLMIVSILFSALLALAATWWERLDADPVVRIPEVKLPNPNAFDLYADASAAISTPNAIAAAIGKPSRWGGRRATAPKKYSLAEQQTLVTDNAWSLQAARDAFAYDCRYPAARSFLGGFVAARLENLVYLLVLEGHIKAARGDRSGALNSYLDAVRIGCDIQHGALYCWWRGVSFQQRGREEIWKVLNSLRGAETRVALRRLQSITARAPALADVLQEEKWNTQAALMELFRKPGWRKIWMDLYDPDWPWDQRLRLRFYSKRRIMESYTKFMDAAIIHACLPYPARKPIPPLNDPVLGQGLVMSHGYIHGSIMAQDAVNRAQNALLEIALALRAFRLERGAYPPSLAQLAPQYLKRVPDDPFARSGTPRYKRTGQKYSLYSLGPDGKDDGGQPIPEKPEGYNALDANSKGDIVAGVNIR